MQAAVHDCLGQAIAQHCRIVGRDSSDTGDSDGGDSDSVSGECLSSLRSEPDPDMPAHASEHTAGKSKHNILRKQQLSVYHAAPIGNVVIRCVLHVGQLAVFLYVAVHLVSQLFDWPICRSFLSFLVSAGAQEHNRLRVELKQADDQSLDCRQTSYVLGPACI